MKSKLGKRRVPLPRLAHHPTLLCKRMLKRLQWPVSSHQVYKTQWTHRAPTAHLFLTDPLVNKTGQRISATEASTWRPITAVAWPLSLIFRAIQMVTKSTRPSTSTASNNLSCLKTYGRCQWRWSGTGPTWQVVNTPRSRTALWAIRRFRIAIISISSTSHRCGSGYHRNYGVKVHGCRRKRRHKLVFLAGHDRSFTITLGLWYHIQGNCWFYLNWNEFLKLGSGQLAEMSCFVVLGLGGSVCLLNEAWDWWDEVGKKGWIMYLYSACLGSFCSVLLFVLVLIP